MNSWNKKNVLTFGTFDILHLGHQYYLHEAKQYGDNVITIVARDKTVEKIKRKSPYYNESERIQNLITTWWSDKVILWQEDDYYRCIEELNPVAICMWYDQKLPPDFNHQVQHHNTILQYKDKSIPIITIAPYHDTIRKSNLLKDKII